MCWLFLSALHIISILLFLHIVEGTLQVYKGFLVSISPKRINDFFIIIIIILWILPYHVVHVVYILANKVLSLCMAQEEKLKQFKATHSGWIKQLV